jgi:hypothetical protein
MGAAHFSLMYKAASLVERHVILHATGRLRYDDDCAAHGHDRFWNRMPTDQLMELSRKLYAVDRRFDDNCAALLCTGVVHPFVMAAGHKLEIEDPTVFTIDDPRCDRYDDFRKHFVALAKWEFARESVIGKIE